jgi:hypothetical protein
LPDHSLHLPCVHPNTSICSSKRPREEAPADGGARAPVAEAASAAAAAAAGRATAAAAGAAAAAAPAAAAASAPSDAGSAASSSGVVVRDGVVAPAGSEGRVMTAAERAFEEAQRKRLKEMAKKVGAKTHEEKIQE